MSGDQENPENAAAAEPQDKVANYQRGSLAGAAQYLSYDFTLPHLLKLIEPAVDEWVKALKESPEWTPILESGKGLTLVIEKDTLMDNRRRVEEAEDAILTNRLSKTPKPEEDLGAVRAAFEEKYGKVTTHLVDDTLEINIMPPWHEPAVQLHSVLSGSMFGNDHSCYAIAPSRAAIASRDTDLSKAAGIGPLLK